MIVKAVIRLSDPAAMDLVLRKRICFNVYKRHSITDKIRRRMGHTSSLTSLGVVYEIVSNIPKVSSGSDTIYYTRNHGSRIRDMEAEWEAESHN